MRIFPLFGANDFPMVAIRLNLRVIILTSFVGGLAAATYYLFARLVDDNCHTEADFQPVKKHVTKTTTLNLMIVGGQEAVKMRI